MLLFNEFKEAVKHYIPHDEYFIEKLTLKSDGMKGYRLTLYKPKNNLHLLSVHNLGLEVNMNQSFYEPSYRHVVIFIEKT